MIITNTIGSKANGERLSQLSTLSSNMETKVEINAIGDNACDRKFCRSLLSRRKTLDKITDVFSRNNGIHAEKVTKFLSFLK